MKNNNSWNLKLKLLLFTTQGILQGGPRTPKTMSSSRTKYPSSTPISPLWCRKYYRWDWRIQADWVFPLRDGTMTPGGLPLASQPRLHQRSRTSWNDDTCHAFEWWQSGGMTVFKYVYCMHIKLSTEICTSSLEPNVLKYTYDKESWTKSSEICTQGVWNQKFWNMYTRSLVTFISSFFSLCKQTQSILGK